MGCTSSKEVARETIPAAQKSTGQMMAEDRASGLEPLTPEAKSQQLYDPKIADPKEPPDAIAESTSKQEDTAEGIGTFPLMSSTAKESATMNEAVRQDTAESVKQPELETLEPEKKDTIEAVDAAEDLEHRKEESTNELDEQKSEALEPKIAETEKGVAEPEKGVAEIEKHALAAAEDPEQFMEKSPEGIYLVYEATNQGTFLAKYSKTVVPGALAFAAKGERTTIPGFKYKQASTVMNKVTAGKKNYFEGWCQWFKEARLIDGRFVILPGLKAKIEEDPDKLPKMRIFLLQGTKVIEPGTAKGNAHQLKNTDAIVCVPSSYTAFDDIVRRKSEIDKLEFVNKAKAPQDYGYIEF